MENRIITNIKPSNGFTVESAIELFSGNLNQEYIFNALIESSQNIGRTRSIFKQALPIILSKIQLGELKIWHIHKTFYILKQITEDSKDASEILESIRPAIGMLYEFLIKSIIERHNIDDVYDIFDTILENNQNSQLLAKVIIFSLATKNIQNFEEPKILNMFKRTLMNNQNDQQIAELIIGIVDRNILYFLPSSLSEIFNYMLFSNQNNQQVTKLIIGLMDRNIQHFALDFYFYSIITGMLINHEDNQFVAELIISLVDRNIQHFEPIHLYIRPGA